MNSLNSRASTPRRPAVAGLARLISLIATVVFTILALFGLNFFWGGRLVATAVVGFPAAALLAHALTTMCRCKAERQGSHRSRERLATLVAVLIMAVGSVFVSNFISVIAQRHALRNAMSETIATMSRLDADYHTYADARIAAAPKRLRSTLTILLYPDEESAIWEKRHEWLDGLKGDDVWNIFMPANIRSLNDAATQWADEYAKVSAVILRDEPADCAPFAYTAGNTRLADILTETHRFGLPDAKGAAADALLIALMLLCYAVIRRPTSDVEGTHR